MSRRTSFRRILVIHNPAAGRGNNRSTRRAIQNLFDAGSEVTIRETQGPGHAQFIANAVVDYEFDLIIAAGGDGTVNEIINGLRTSVIPLAVLPTGTANVLAAELGASSLSRTPLDGEIETAWVGELNRRRFALMASVGFDAEVVARVNGWTKKLFGKYAYVAGACREWAAMRPLDFEIVADGRSYTAAAAIIAKGRYYGGLFEICPISRVTAPTFQLCLLGGGRRSDVLRYAFSLYRGRLHLEPDVHVVEAREIAIRGPKGAPIQLDGDIRAWSPAVAKISPVPLQLFRPKQCQASGHSGLAETPSPSVLEEVR